MREKVTLPKAKRSQFTFLLLPEFSMLSLMTALETLQNYNLYAGKLVYKWQVCSPTDGPVVSSLGTAFPPDTKLSDARKSDVIAVVGGTNIARHTCNKSLSIIREKVRRGAFALGLCTASYAIAKAGLANGERVALHWNYHENFAETFLDTTLSKSAYVLSDRIGTTAGGVAAIDLLLKIIEQDRGASQSTAVANHMNYTPVRLLQEKLDLTLHCRVGIRHPRMVRVLELMDANTETPLTTTELAQDVSLSTRQLERLFQRFLGSSPNRYYRELRLTKARNLLLQTEMSTLEISLATGFSTAANFSKLYKQKFGTRPSQARLGNKNP